MNGLRYGLGSRSAQRLTTLSSSLRGRSPSCAVAATPTEDRVTAPARAGYRRMGTAHRVLAGATATALAILYPAAAQAAEPAPDAEYTLTLTP